MKKKLSIRLRTVILAGILLTLAAGLHISSAQNGYVIPGDARKGWKVFAEKGCIQCHSMGTQGTMMAPDLSKTPRSHLSASGMAAEMWNHAPGMWEKISAKSIEFKRIKEPEMADLFAFVYIMRYMDEPGDPDRGREVMVTKRCAECHGVGDKKGKIGPDLSLWSGFTNPILWIQMMWNHAPIMKKEMDRAHIPWPKLGGNDIVDIIAYVRSLKPSEQRVFLAPGDPAEGKKLFSQEGCSQCHAIRGKGGTKGPDLGVQKKDFPPTLSRLAGLMWDHFPQMFSEMEKQDIKVPQFTAKDMADITAYLFSIRYFDPAGNMTAGKRLFQEKRCVVCHNIRAEAKGRKEGPNLSKAKGKMSPIFMATALWNHGPTMIGKMKEKNIKWQKITDKDLLDLMEYLNRGD